MPVRPAFYQVKGSTFTRSSAAELYSRLRRRSRPTWTGGPTGPTTGRTAMRGNGPCGTLESCVLTTVQSAGRPQRRQRPCRRVADFAVLPDVRCLVGIPGRALLDGCQIVS